MPPRDPSLPEGTDHIIDTNIDLGDPGGGGSGIGGGTTGSGAGGGGAGGGSGGGASGGGFGGAGAGGSSGGTTGSTGTGSTGTGSGGTGGSAFRFDKQGQGDGNSGFSSQIRDQINTLKSQAGERARGFADDGKRQATDFLQTIAQVVADAAGSVEEKLGGQYAGMGHKASSSISSFASTLDQRSVDDMIEDARAFVQRSPAAAIGIATVIGFAVARVVRAGVIDARGGSDMGGQGSMTGTGTTVATTGGDSDSVGGGAMGAGATGGLGATSGGFGQSGAGTAGTMGGTGTSSSGAGSSGAGSSAPTY